jgi:hypothetical protein
MIYRLFLQIPRKKFCTKTTIAIGRFILILDPLNRYKIRIMLAIKKNVTLDRGFVSIRDY